MFWNKNKNTETVGELKEKIEDYRSKVKDYQNALEEKSISNKLEIRELKHAHNLELLSKQFEIEHKTDKDKDELKKEVVRLEKALEVMTKEKNMLEKIVDINSDLMDIKDFMKKLMEKIPTIDIKSLNVTSSKK